MGWVPLFLLLPAHRSCALSSLFFVYETVIPNNASYAGMLPPYATQSEEARAMARHTSMGIEPRVSAERFILLDTQVYFGFVSSSSFL